jgi:YggT family protein
MELFASSFATFLNIYVVIVIIRVLLTWFPNIDFYNPPFSILSQLVDPYLNIFRSIIPPLGGMDFSPILAILLLQLLGSLVSGIASNPSSIGL